MQLDEEPASGKPRRRRGFGLGRIFRNPDVYSMKDAAFFAAKEKDRQFAFGSGEIDPSSLEGKARVYSLPPEVLENVEGIVNDSTHWHVLPFIMGTYNISSQSMRMNDVCLFDPYFALLLATGGLEAWPALSLRAIYFAGRRSWWRHESLHVRHHYLMADFLSQTRDDNIKLLDDVQRRINEMHKKEGIDTKQNDERRLHKEYFLDLAGYTIHESGVEELLTRWQSMKERRGARESALSFLTLLLYLEYTPFTGLRNALIDAKDYADAKIPEGAVRIPLKAVATAALMGGPLVTEARYDLAGQLAQAASLVTPISNAVWERALGRSMSYYIFGVLSALFSSKNKGAYKNAHNPGAMRTRDYKFPFTYNPVTAFSRSIGLIRYLNKAWNTLPSYREIKAKSDIEVLREEINARVQQKFGNTQQRQFTMNVVDDVLSPMLRAPPESFPKGAYIRGMFTPALYLRLKEIYPPNASRGA